MNKSYLTLSFFFLFGCTESTIVTKEETESIIKIADLTKGIKGFVPDQSKESLVKKKEFNNGYQLVYTFTDAGFHVHHGVSVRKSKTNALIDQKAHAFALEVAMNKAEPVERNDLFTWGDESSFNLLKRKRDGAFVGNALIARKGTRSFFLIFVGICFQNPESIRALLEPKLKAAEQLPEP